LHIHFSQIGLDEFLSIEKREKSTLHIHFSQIEVNKFVSIEQKEENVDLNEVCVKEENKLLNTELLTQTHFY